MMASGLYSEHCDRRAKNKVTTNTEPEDTIDCKSIAIGLNAAWREKEPAGKIEGAGVTEVKHSSELSARGSADEDDANEFYRGSCIYCGNTEAQSEFLKWGFGFTKNGRKEANGHPQRDY